ncbi:hypothetical protein BT96DRAFT_917871, partial [Gymnopus androsaceus JB14]
MPKSSSLSRSIFNIQCSISTLNIQFNCSAQHSKPTQHLPYRYQTQNPSASGSSALWNSNWVAALSSSGYCAD